MSAIPELSVVVLGYRAGEGLRAFVDEIERELEPLGIERELLLVANTWPGADDPTPRVAAELAAADSRRRALALRKLGGMGWDMKSGFAAARGRVVAVIDGDGQMPGADVARVYRALRESDAGLAKTYRERRDDGATRRVVSFAFNAIFRLLFPGLGVRDVNAKPKALERSALGRMRLDSDAWFIDAEIVLEARRLGLGIVEVPTVFGRLEERASFIRLSTLFQFLVDLARARWRLWMRRR